MPAEIGVGAYHASLAGAMKDTKMTQVAASVRAGFSPGISLLGISARKHRFRKQGKSARQNTSPAFVVQCHGARTRYGPRGGGRLRFCPLVAVAPPSLFASPALPADAA